MCEGEGVVKDVVRRERCDDGRDVGEGIGVVSGEMW